MSMTAEELRKFPLKDVWTPEEAMALYESVDGHDVIHGVPPPFYVQTYDDRVRWANAFRVAAQTTGLPADSPVVGNTARILYNDREQYTS